MFSDLLSSLGIGSSSAGDVGGSGGMMNGVNATNGIGEGMFSGMSPENSVADTNMFGLTNLQMAGISQQSPAMSNMTSGFANAGLNNYRDVTRDNPMQDMSMFSNPSTLMGWLQQADYQNQSQKPYTDFMQSPYLSALIGG